MIHVKLLAFAQAAVELGWREMPAECAPTETPREIFGRLAPGFSPRAARVAADCEYHSWDEAIGLDTRELAVIPPVSGG